jgi:hypothetical protein
VLSHGKGKAGLPVAERLWEVRFVGGDGKAGLPVAERLWEVRFVGGDGKAGLLVIGCNPPVCA